MTSPAPRTRRELILSTALEGLVCGLAPVAPVVRALLAEGASLAEAHLELLAAVDAGAIELRPEAGGEFMAPAVAELCPAGPRGTVFTYLRILDGGEATPSPSGVATVKRPGRPPRADVAASEIFRLRVTPAERKALDELAEARGVSASELVRTWIELARSGVLVPAARARKA